MVVDVVHDDDVELCAKGVHGGMDGVEDARMALSLGEEFEGVRVEGVQADVEMGQAGLLEVVLVAMEEDCVGGYGEVRDVELGEVGDDGDEVGA